MSDDAAAIRAGMAALARRKWAMMTPAEQTEHVRRMIAGQRRKRLHLRAKAKGGAKT